MTLALPRLLLVDDDAVLRRFVRMALEDIPLDLIECDSVAAALQVLSSTPVQLIMTDLMMPGESGLGLLQRLMENPALRGGARVVVLSAGLSPAKREQLVHMDVWSMLDKPVSVGQLIACVEEGLAPTVHVQPPARATPTPPPQGSARAEAQTVIDQYFAGNAELFRAYRQSCLVQFSQDVQEGDAACEIKNLATLRRVSHNLKSVLRMLGYPAWSAMAEALEQHCEAGLGAEASAGWPALRGHVVQLVQSSQRVPTST